MAKPKKATVVQASDSEQSSPLPELANKKKQNAPIVQAPSKGKPAQKPAPQKQQSQEETPVQDKKKVVKAPRKGSKASVDEDTPAPAARKGSVDKPNAKKPIKAKEPSSEEEQVKPKKAVVAKKPLKPVKDESESSEQEVAKKPAPKAAQKPVGANLKNKKKQESQEQSQDEIIAPKKKVVVPQTKDKKEVKKSKQQSQSEEEEAPKKIVAKPQAKKVVKPESESEQQSSQQKPKPVRKGSKEVAAKKAVKVVAKQQSEEQQKPKARKASKDAIKTEAKKPAKKVQESEQQQSEQQKPQPTKKKAVPKKIEQQEESEEEKPAPKRKGSADIKKAAKQQPVAEEEEEEQGQFEVAVQGLSFNAFDADVRDLFDSCGNILNVKLISRPDGKPKGFAFVKFSTKSSFNKALELNGTEHMGRQIRVEEARNNNQKQDQRGGNNNRNGGQAPTGDAVIETPTLFIGGLSYNSTVDSIKEFFSSSGQVQSARIVTDKQTGKPRGFGYVEFYDVDSAKKAYQELNGQYLDGRQIRLDSAAQRDRPQGGNFGNRQGGGFGGNGGGFRNNNNRQGSAVALSQDDKFAKKGAIASFAGKKIQL